MTALNRQTGRRMDPDSDEHLIQSVGDILTTPLGTRVGRRDYGALHADLVDLPHNAATRLKVYASTAMALMRWEPRVRLKRVQLAGGADGSAGLRLDLVRVDRPRRPTITLTIPLAA